MPWSILVITKFVTTAILALLSLIDLVYQLSAHVFPVYITASVIKLITYLVVLNLQYKSKKAGLVTSAILLLFWTLSGAAGAFSFRSVLNSGHLSGTDKVLPLITAAIQYPLVLAAFFMSCWADPKPLYIDVDGKILFHSTRHAFFKGSPQVGPMQGPTLTVF